MPRQSAPPTPPSNGAPNASARSEEEPRLFDRFRRRADRMAHDEARVSELVDDASTKFSRYREHLGSLATDLPVLLRMAHAYTVGEYRRVPWKALVMIVAALLYFFSPLDAIPDFIPVLGFVDDAAVVAYVLRQIRNEVERFAEWEADRPAGGRARLPR